MIPQGKGAIPSRSKLQYVDARAARQRPEGTGHQDQGVSAWRPSRLTASESASTVRVAAS